MTEQIIIAGFGGQGVLTMGHTIAYAGMTEGKNVSWLPSYGPEMRGGTANCNVIISSAPIASPVVTQADTVIVMNKPSLDKFAVYLKPGGRLFVNTSLIENKCPQNGIDFFGVPANDIAALVGNARVANMVMLSAYIAVSHILSKDSIITAVKYMLGEKKAHLFAVNQKAMDEGEKCVCF